MPPPSRIAARLFRRGMHSSPRLAKRPQDETGRITGGGVGTKGRTAGGKALDSTAPGAPDKPMIFNFSTPGAPGEEQNLSEEQKKEVEEHNREFAKTHNDEGENPENKVDEKFWNGNGDGKKRAEGRKQ